ncbi:FGGY family carbohydrate kinase [Mycolicibacterium agri]|nr:FGGY family carbohydrate kinase [Mycolicibacterium agri]GFG52428.1 glycerol kinase [Mycolicibacterium agri]
MASPSSFILSIDQGTSSTKAMLVDSLGGVYRSASCPVGQSHPHPGWVEQSAAEIWASIRRAVRDCVTDDIARAVVGVALSVQRESVTMWDTNTGASIGPVLSWQDQRTAPAADELERAGVSEKIFATSGLPLDPMFSALKAGWLLDEFDPQRDRARSGRWRIGTIDAWLLSRFGGEPVTEAGNASRTQLLNIHTASWDSSLLEMFGVPEGALPRVVASTGPFPTIRDLDPLPDGLPVLAVLADSHAALFAHAGWRPGVVKATYGTGSSVMAIGPHHTADSGVCSTIAWDVGGVTHALEANIRSTGRTMSWLSEVLDVDVDRLWHDAETATSDGVVMVPAFGGLGAPVWDRNATPVISGLSLGTRRPQLARAALESIAFQIDDVIAAFRDTAGPMQGLACDGGMTRSRALMQLQADISGLPVYVSTTPNLSALGAAYLAGLQVGWWTFTALEDAVNGTEDRPLLPQLDDDERQARRDVWANAVNRSRGASEAPATSTGGHAGQSRSHTPQP